VIPTKIPISEEKPLSLSSAIRYPTTAPAIALKITDITNEEKSMKILA
jgi:hypothetical protein